MPAIDAYQATAARYDRDHGRWLRYAGGEAQCAGEGAISALLAPGMRVLDAACGTGRVARRLNAQVPGLDLTLLDAASAMLAFTSDLKAACVHARMEAMPLPTGHFDLVTCTWGLETSQAPATALAELIRVLHPGGHLLLVFCADKRAGSFFGRLLRHRVSTRGLGQFLDTNWVADQAQRLGAAEIRRLHCTGPAAALLIRSR
ncbi:MAG: class I SAM-dependent methyltransferase [Pseudomonadota bacterium]